MTAEQFSVLISVLKGINASLDWIALGIFLLLIFKNMGGKS